MKHFIFTLSLLALSLAGVANNMLVQNVTTLGNDPVNKTIQVQFDISWDNSWRDAINYDAAWIFMKFKNASGVWQHAQLNPTGFANGSGTANTLQVTADKVGSWLYRSGLGSGTFTSTGMQLQWNYGLSGLTNVTGLEVRVFAVEMVYVPEGDFNCFGAMNSNYDLSFYYALSNCQSGYCEGIFNAPGVTFPVINNRLSPTLKYFGLGTANYYYLRIKGDAGIDIDNNGTIDNSSYPLGYRAFYCFKYELSEQQYADFLNTLTGSQISSVGIAGAGVILNNGVYYTSTPNRACGNSTPNRFLAFADWAGIRPISFLEFNKVSYGPVQPVYNNALWLGLSNPASNFSAYTGGYPAWGSASMPTDANGSVSLNNTNSLKEVGYMGNSTSNRLSCGASYFGVLDLTGNAKEPVVKLDFFSFSALNGNGQLNSVGNSDVSNWNNSMVMFLDQRIGNFNQSFFGFRYVRSAE